MTIGGKLLNRNSICSETGNLQYKDYTGATNAKHYWYVSQNIILNRNYSILTTEIVLLIYPTSYYSVHGPNRNHINRSSMSVSIRQLRKLKKLKWNR